MSNPYIGEIRIFAGNFAPVNWALCAGQLMSIAQNEALFQLIGTTYGGDGQSTFALPDLRGRIPINMGQLAGGQNYTIGQMGGAENVTLTPAQIASHSHAALCNTQSGNTTSPSGAIWAASTSGDYIATASPTGTMAANLFTGGGGNQPHSNLQPFVVFSFILALFGIFPSQS